MPRYYLHIRDHEGLREDPEGSEFADIGEAHDEALEAARELLADKILANDIIDGSRFEITDENGVVQLVAPFRSALRLS